jgi:uncharacterized spore protein YtfJ
MEFQEIQETISKARDAITVKRVYGAPYERDGVTVIPAASVSGGAGGGLGQSEADEHGSGAGSGGGTGFGLNARPAGAYVIHGGDVRWVPAFDATRILGQAMVAAAAVAFLLAARRRG